MVIRRRLSVHEGTHELGPRAGARPDGLRPDCPRGQRSFSRRFSADSRTAGSAATQRGASRGAGRVRARHRRRSRCAGLPRARCPSGPGRPSHVRPDAGEAPPEPEGVRARAPRRRAAGRSRWAVGAALHTPRPAAARRVRPRRRQPHRPPRRRRTVAGAHGRRLGQPSAAALGSRSRPTSRRLRTFRGTGTRRPRAAGG